MSVPIEKVPENKFEIIDVIEYLGRLGKITYTITNKKLTKKAKNDLLNDYVKLEKQLKNQLEKEGREKIPKKNNSTKNTNFRKYAKKYFLTISKTDASKSDVFNYYLKNEKMNIKKAAIAQEKHKDGTNHLHIYLEFAAKKDIRKKNYFNLPDTFKKYGNINTDWDTLKKRTKENVYSYMLKSDKNAYSYGFNIRKDCLGKLKEKEIWYKIAIGEWSLKDYILYDPSLLGKNIPKLHDRLLENEKYIKKYFKIDIKEFLW